MGPIDIEQSRPEVLLWVLERALGRDGEGSDAVEASPLEDGRLFLDRSGLEHAQGEGTPLNRFGFARLF